VSELASLRQADTLFPPPSPMLGAGQREILKPKAKSLFKVNFDEFIKLGFKVGSGHLDSPVKPENDGGKPP